MAARTKRLHGILKGFPNVSRIGSTAFCRGETHRYTVQIHQSPSRYTHQNRVGTNPRWAQDITQLQYVVSGSSTSIFGESESNVGIYL